ncbi:hypothetical protein [Terriglobus roseus]|uniref:DUF4105 domain-containing protein n=1 Tax=Terriglobus roseus TaxID=392734 RepID=A0A1G7EP55_9BACT|nr:hypothetical protein [Terriglobus roseus]SDE65165.1 hypothetical protein SAMN05444167_0043 [Terriglobus roseus]
MIRRLFASTSLLFALTCSVVSHADVALLMEQPYGEFGKYNPTGHAAVFLSDICAETPTQLRRCNPGEYGSVISRYHKIHHQDWIAMPLVPYLYGVERPSEIPASVTKEQVKQLRDAYWRAHLQELAPPDKNGNAPGGEWPQLVGSLFDRTIFGFAVHSTQEQDDRFIAIFNDKRNVGHFNLFFHNCADFSRVVLNTYYPGAIHRNVFGDFGMTTPKGAAKSLVKYGQKHPELHPTTFEMHQVPGDMPRSTNIDGVSESLVKSKKYLIPLAILQPEVTGVIAADFLTRGRAKLPRTATAFAVGDWKIQPQPSNETASHPDEAGSPKLGS